MPQLCIKDNTLRTESGLRTFSSVMGHIPPLAKVAAMIDIISQFASIEQHWKKETVRLEFVFSYLVKTYLLFG